MNNRFGVEAPEGVLEAFRRHQQELAFWERNDAEFAGRYAGNFVVARDGRVIGAGNWEDVEVLLPDRLGASASVRYYARPEEIWIL